MTGGTGAVVAAEMSRSLRGGHNDVERLGHLAARAEKPPTFRHGHFEARAMGLGWRRSGTKIGL